MPIELPMQNEVYDIEIKRESIVIKYTDDTEIMEILKIISNANPTRKITAHERPIVREYITISFNTKDERAKKCYEKCGFKVEGVLKQELFRDGKYYDEYIM